MPNIIASPYTRLFWNEYQINPNRTDYHIVFDQTIIGSLDITRLSDALEKLIKDHVLLNSHLIEIEGQLYWKRNKEINPLHVFNDSTVNQEQFVKQPFNLETGPLYHFGLFKKSNNRYDIILILHHALVDGHSVNEFMDLVSYYYNDTQNQLVDIIQQARDIQILNEWLRKKLNCLEKYNPVKYWQKCLADLPEKNSFPYLPGKNNQSDQVGEYCFKIKGLNVSNDFYKKLRTTWFTVVINVWGVLIAKYCNAQHIHIGYPISIKEGIDFIYGGQINTLVLPIRLNRDITFRELIAQSNQLFKTHKINSLYRYSYLPTNKILSCSSIRSLNIYTAVTNLKDKQFDFQYCQASVNKRYNIGMAGSELILEYSRQGEVFNYQIRFRSDLFSQKFIHQLVKQFQYLLHRLIAHPDSQLSEFSLLIPNEYQKIVYHWNRTERDYPTHKTITQLFESQASKTPDHIALICEDQRLTYRQLNAYANQLARYLRRQYLSKTGQALMSDTLIALCLDRSLEMIIALLGILKAGGAYVPIDPHYPKQRIQYILEDTQAQLLLTQAHLEDQLASCVSTDKIQRIAIDTLPYNTEAKTNLALPRQSTDLAYVIYTSGTTGQPKGVMLAHNGLVNLAYVQKKNSKLVKRLAYYNRPPLLLMPQYGKYSVPYCLVRNYLLCLKGVLERKSLYLTI